MARGWSLGLLLGGRLVINYLAANWHGTRKLTQPWLINFLWAVVTHKTLRTIIESLYITSWYKSFSQIQISQKFLGCWRSDWNVSKGLAEDLGLGEKWTFWRQGDGGGGGCCAGLHGELDFWICLDFSWALRTRVSPLLQPHLNPGSARISLLSPVSAAQPDSRNQACF